MSNLSWTRVFDRVQYTGDGGGLRNWFRIVSGSPHNRAIRIWGNQDEADFFVAD